MLRRELPDRNKWPANTVGYTAPLSGDSTAPVHTIDVNCDMGEGMDSDAIIMPFISSVNIACGYHAGDEDTMRRTVELALSYGVAIGAHPSYPDRENFGRVDMPEDMSPGRLAEIIVRQLDSMQNICKEYGVRLHHVKPHGALYNRAARDTAIGAIVCQAVHTVDPSLIIYGLSGSAMETDARCLGLRFVNEVFADRTYREDGHLVSRSEPNALITDPALAVTQVLQMIRDGKVVATSGREILLKAETVCIHGDGPHASEFARAIHGEIRIQGIRIQAP
jgi:5-oxoprolinase (ATP-hydrolysing) subunit A